MRDLLEHRCPKCGKLLYKGEIIQIEIKCPRCKAIVYKEILELKQKVKENSKCRSKQGLDHC